MDAKYLMEKKFLALFVLICFSLALGGQRLYAASGKYPEKPITHLCAFAPGGVADLTPRILAKAVGDELGQPVLCINKPGAGGVIGFLELEKAPPDGYTIGGLTMAATVVQYTSPNPTNIYNTVPISLVTSGPATLTIKADAPWKNAQEFIAYARSNPGKIRNANSGIGASSHIFAAAFDSLVGIKETHVPFTGYAPAVAALAGGHVEATCSPVGDVHPMVKAGKLRILGIASEERHFLFPDVPTFREQNIDFVMGNFVGVGAPRGTPQEILNLLDLSIRKALQRPEVKKGFIDIGYPVIYKNSKDFSEFIKKEDTFLRELVEKIGARVAPKK